MLFLSMLWFLLHSENVNIFHRDVMVKKEIMRISFLYFLFILGFYLDKLTQCIQEVLPSLQMRTMSHIFVQILIPNIDHRV